MRAQQENDREVVKSVLIELMQGEGILAEDIGPADLGASFHDLAHRQLIDSLGVAQVLALVEMRYGVVVPAAMLEAELTDIDALAAYVAESLPSRAA